MTGYSPPPLSERSDADLVDTLAFFEHRARQWGEYADRFSDPAGLMRIEAGCWSRRAEAVRAEMATRNQQEMAA